MWAPSQCFSPQINNWYSWQLKRKIKIQGPVLELPARTRCQSSPFTVFPRIFSAETILFWKLKCGNYSREETIQRRKLLFYGNFWHFDITHKLFQSTSIDVFTTQNIKILAKMLKKSSLFHGNVLRNIFLDSNDAIYLAK